MMKTGIFGVVAFSALAAVPGYAQEESAFGFTGEEFAQGRAEALPDRAASADAIAVSPEGAVEMLGFRLRGDSAVLDAERVMLLPGGELRIEEGTLSSKREGQGVMLFREAGFSSQQMLERLMLGDSCDPFTMGGQGSEPLGGFEMAGAEIRPPAGVLPDPSGLHQGGGPERLRADKVSMSFEGVPGTDCFMVSRFALSQASAAAADGTTGHIAEIEGQASLLPSSGDPYALSVTATEAVSRDAAGLELMRTGSSLLSFSLDGSIADGIRHLPDLPDDQVVPEIARLLAGGDFGFSYQVDGLQMPLGELLSSSQRVRFGSDGGERVAGAAEFSVASKGDQLRILGEATLEGFADALLDLSMIIDPDGGGANAMALTGGHPMGVAVPFLKIGGLTFSFEDKGLWDMVERGTGRVPEAHLAAIRPMIMKAPEEISKPLYDWLTGLARTGKGGAVMDPIEPVGVMEAGMAAMMNPGGLRRLLEIRAE